MEESFFHYQDPAFALHGMYQHFNHLKRRITQDLDTYVGVLVLIGITLTLRPLFPYTSVTFLFQELYVHMSSCAVFILAQLFFYRSTPFLNLHWSVKIKHILLPSYTQKPGS